MIETRVGNCLDIKEGFIVHGCNTMGVMGSGIAKEVKARFPLAYEIYREKYDELPEDGGGLNLGEVIPIEVGPNKWIINAMTQHLYGTGERRVNYEAVAKCFEEVTQIAIFLSEERGKIFDIVFPKIGAGLGGGDWEIIEKIIDRTVPDEFKKIVYVLA